MALLEYNDSKFRSFSIDYTLDSANLLTLHIYAYKLLQGQGSQQKRSDFAFQICVRTATAALWDASFSSPSLLRRIPSGLKVGHTHSANTLMQRANTYTLASLGMGLSQVGLCLALQEFSYACALWVYIWACLLTDMQKSQERKIALCLSLSLSSNLPVQLSEVFSDCIRQKML